jgi:hypothetical protein
MPNMKTHIVMVQATGHSVTLPAADGLSYRPINEDATFALIGRVAVWSAYVDRLVERMIWLLMGVGAEAGAAATGKMANTDQLFTRAIKLARSKPMPDGFITKLEAAHQATLDLRDQRARILHDPWHVSSIGELAQFRAAPKGASQVFGFVDVSEQEVRDVIGRYEAHFAEVGALHDKLKTAGP